MGHLMRLKRAICLVLLTSGASITGALAQTPPPTEQLNQLVSAGQFDEAFEMGNSQLAMWEGDSEFDILFGIAALETGNINESIFALERVVVTGETSILRQRARLELARAHLLTNNLPASEALFNEVLASNPPQNVQDNIQAFLALIEARRNSQRSQVTFSVAPQFGHDDNINSATANGLIDTPLIGEIELGADGLKTADDFADLTVGLGFRRPFTRDTSIDANLILNRHDNQSSSQFDMDYALADLTYGWGGEVNRFRHSVQFQRVYLDKEAFQGSLRFNNSWQRAGQNGWYQSLAASVSTTRNDNTPTSPRNDLKDTNQLLLSGTLTKLTERFTNSLTLFYADDKVRDSAGEHNGRSYYGVAHNVLWRFNNSHTPYVRVSLQKTKHDDEHPIFFNDVRSDTSTSAAVGWSWTYSNRLTMSAEASYSSGDSNIPLFEYTRSKFQAGFKFQL
jgi:hypothetical protein